VNSGRAGVTPERPLELMRQAVIRDGYRCSICGRPCSEEEARRHSEASAFGDSSMNFAAMCYGCQTWLAHEGAKPAQYITHIYDQSKVRMRLRHILDDGLAILVIGIYVAYAIFAFTIMYWTRHDDFAVFGSGLLIFLLLYLGGSLVIGSRSRPRSPNSAQSVLHNFNDQAVRLDNMP
jgi:hypothetical protein